VCILNILITLFFRQCLKVTDVHPDLQQLAYGLVKVRSYGRYDVNCFRFDYGGMGGTSSSHPPPFESPPPVHSHEEEEEGEEDDGDE
jgi:hypothetical protein